MNIDVQSVLTVVGSNSVFVLGGAWVIKKVIWSS